MKAQLRPNVSLGRYWPVGLLVVLGGGLTLVLAALNDRHQAERREQHFLQQAEYAATAVRSKLGDHLEVLLSVRDLYEASTEVSRADFKRFAHRQLSRQSGLHAIEWIPRVGASERQAFERSARESGLRGFSFTEGGPGGRLIPARPRPEYYPVFYVEPLSGNKRALGYAPVLPVRDAAIEEAWRTGNPVVSARFRLLQEPADRYGVALFVPVFREGRMPATPAARHAQLVGLVEGVLRIEDMVQAAVAGLDLSGLALTLTDESARPSERMLATWPGSGGAHAESSWQEAFEMGGRRWRIRLDSSAQVPNPFLAPWSILLGGFLVTGLAGAYLYNLMSRKEEIVAQVEVRTQELSNATEELRRSEAIQRAIITNATDVIFIKDLEGRYLLANPAVCRVLGMPLERIIGATDEALFPQLLAEQKRSLDRQAIKHGLVQTTLDTLETASDGRRIFLVTKFPYRSATDATLGVIGIGRDVTALQEAEMALREERDRAQRYLDVAGVMIVVIDPTGHLTLANRMAGEILGYPPAEMLGWNWFETFVAPSEHEAAWEAFSSLVARHEPTSSHFENQVRTRDGDQRRIVWHNVTLHDARGEIVGVLCSGSDVTDYKRAIEEVARREAELAKVREIDRLKSNFVSSISHDLRTPLTSIKGYAEFLEDGIGGDLSPQQQEFVAQIGRGTRRLENLVDDLLDFARFDAGTFTLRCERVDLGGSLREMAASMQPQCEENRLRLRLMLPSEPLDGHLDQQRIERVLANLLSNAIKFTPPGGEIVLRAERQGDLLRCEVVDSGPGIEHADQPKLFQRFSQLATGLHKGGTGLGLSISKAILEAHGGHIGVTSEAGAGATFWFTLPVAHPDLVAAEGVHYPPDHPHARQ